MYQTLSELTSFCERYDKSIWRGLVHSFNFCSLAKRECYVSQGSVETLFRRGAKHLHYCMANLLRTIRAKFY